MKDTEIKILSSETILKARVFEISKHRIAEDGLEYDREIVEHSGSAVILPIFDNGDIILVRQYRHAAQRFLLEIPAGTVEKDEFPADCAAREIEEETGYKAGKLSKISEFFVSPGFLTEKMHLFVATQLVKTQQNTDGDENIEIVRVPLSEATELVASGDIEDAKTIIGVLTAPNAD